MNPADPGDAFWRWPRMRSWKADGVDPKRVPPLSTLLGFGPMLPIFAGGVAAICGSGAAHSSITALIVLWAASILMFIAGVRRGYGFARQASPSIVSLAGTMIIFALGIVSLVMLLVNLGFALAALILGYASVMVLDPLSALYGEAPRHFVHLRPPQMLVGLVGLGLLMFANR